MLLTLSTTHQPATDLGYLLHKHPGKLQSVDLSHGKAHIFYPQADEERCTVALLLDLDPIDLARGRRNVGGDSFVLEAYVNDRPYVCSSFMSVAIAKSFSSALNGRCKDKPELVEQALPFEVTLDVLGAPKGGELLIRKFFEPLGYSVELERLPLSARFPEWGDSRYFRFKAAITAPLQAVLSHFYVLIPALDSNKHYYIGEQEIEILLKKGEGWLKGHPEREQITRRYLRDLKGLTRRAIEQLSIGETEASEEVSEEPAVVAELRKGLHQQRLETAREALVASGAERVVDLGCGEGKLLRLLLKERQFNHLLGVDVSYAELLKAKERLHWEEMSPRQRERIDLIHGSLTYRDERLHGYDAAAIVEVIEHLDPARLKAFERVVFEFAQPRVVVLTTPNAEYNAVYSSLAAGTFRHSDHRFEWTRAEFEQWATRIAEQYGYQVVLKGVGEAHPEFGGPSQMAVFTHGT
ncbi:MAG: 3' terminal RNA ribose 2'-O-methyltransferase Hen1 [Bacteroidota bacterium]|nr:3' terminal RNA ribose 2'-O-methyltransferase Hen1 [Bacteroidota bacterium]